MEKHTRLTLWLAGVLLLGLTIRVMAFPVGEGPTGLVTFQDTAPGSLALFFIGLVLAGVLVFVMVERTEHIYVPEELKDTYTKLEELEQEIKNLK